MGRCFEKWSRGVSAVKTKEAKGKRVGKKLDPGFQV